MVKVSSPKQKADTINLIKIECASTIKGTLDLSLSSRKYFFFQYICTQCQNADTEYHNNACKSGQNSFFKRFSFHLFEDAFCFGLCIDKINQVFQFNFQIDIIDHHIVRCTQLDGGKV